MFEVFEHTADLGLRITAPDINSLFVEAARGLFSIIVENPDDVRPVEDVEFKVEGKEMDYLLFDWLNELLFAFESKHILFSEFDLKVSDTGLSAKARGERLDADRHRLDHEVKAITYHCLEVTEVEGGWRAEVILDI